MVEVPAEIRWDIPAYSVEMFGPVLTVIRVNTYEEAVEIINENNYGNGASIFTRSGFYARDFTNRAEPGQIGVNVPIPVPLPMFSFTGNKGLVVGDLIYRFHVRRFELLWKGRCPILYSVEDDHFQKENGG